MTPVSDMRKMSLLPDLYRVSRSQSDTSYEGLAAVMTDRRGRRASEWASKEDKKVILRPLQVNEQLNGNGLLYRRLSKASSKLNPVPQPLVVDLGSKDGVTRSYSVKSVKKVCQERQRHRGSSIPTDGNHCGVKVKERTVSNRSLPLPGDETEYLRLRNFSVTSKGVINRGDSFRSKGGFDDMGSREEVRTTISEVSEQLDSNVVQPEKGETKEVLCSQKKPYRVLLIGASSVGKSSLWKQFMTSEYICEQEYGYDREFDRIITVVLNTEESQMEFEEETIQEENAYVTSEADAYVIVYSVTDRRSYAQARHFLSQVERIVDTRAVILVANKTDLARLRAVTTEDGKSLAKDKGCKFIETSVAINHQVDELLAGTLSQIRMKAQVADKLRKKRDSQGEGRRCSIYSKGSKASGVLKRILRRACIKSKSCDNLHVL